jgi:L-lactate dehydrogenase (cytochrome)
LSVCHNIDDLRDRARRRLPRPVFDFLDGGAESESTARRNIAAFDEVRLVPRCLRDVGCVSTVTRLLGQDIEWPVICSPTGASRLFHSDGELAVARAAARAGTVYSVAAGSSFTAEEVAAASPGPKLFQVYLYKDRSLTWSLIERAQRAGYVALALTVDVPVVGKRERDLRSGFGTSPQWTLRNVASFGRHPTWVARRMGPKAITLANFTKYPHAAGEPQQLDPSITWQDVREIISRWRGPFVLKGVMSADDARRAADAGVTAIIVSNHGGRQLDGAAAPLDVLPQIVAAVGNRIEVILEGGIRRGVHVLKALASGATACAVGRPYLYGLAAGGERGVERALNILRTELVLAMTLSGCRDLSGVTAELLQEAS